MYKCVRDEVCACVLTCVVCVCCVVEVENAYILSAFVKLKIVLCFGDLLVTSVL